MKTIFIFLIFIGLIINGLSQTNSVSTQTYSQVRTNWNYHTNSFEVHHGFGGQIATETITRDYADAFIGTITSNTFCDVFYNNSKRQTILLSSNVVGEIKITWQTNVVYTTNFIKNK